MKKISWNAVVILAVAFAVAVALFAVKEVRDAYGPVGTFTLQQAAENYGDFYSLVLDRVDVEEGTFNLNPGPGDRAILVSDRLPKFQEIVIEGSRSVDLSGDEVSISTSPDVVLNRIGLGGVFPDVQTTMRIEWFGEEIIVPLNIRFSADLPEGRLEKEVDRGDGVMRPLLGIVSDNLVEQIENLDGSSVTYDVRVKELTPLGDRDHNWISDRVISDLNWTSNRVISYGFTVMEPPINAPISFLPFLNEVIEDYYDGSSSHGSYSGRMMYVRLDELLEASDEFQRLEDAKCWDYYYIDGEYFGPCTSEESEAYAQLLNDLKQQAHDEVSAALNPVKFGGEEGDNYWELPEFAREYLPELVGRITWIVPVEVTAVGGVELRN